MTAPDNANLVYSLIKKIVRFVEEKDCQVQLVGGFFSNNESVFAAYNGGLILKRNEKVGGILFAGPEIKIIEVPNVGKSFAIKITPEMLLPHKTHRKKGGGVWETDSFKNLSRQLPCLSGMRIFIYPWSHGVDRLSG